MQESIVQVKNLSHRYTASWAIRNINFEINKTGILGLLGSNGAGKSTTMNIMCGVLNQREGDVLINGIDLRKHPEEAKKNIGFLPQNPPLHLELTVDEYLVHCAHMRAISKQQIRTAVEEAKERCGIAHFSRRLIKHLSGGYRQRCGIAQAIVHKPSLVVLDEPTNGLDPNQILEVRKLITEIAEERSVIFSTHILSEVQVLCRDIIMIEQGKIVFSDTMDAFNNYIKPNSLVITMENPPLVEAFRSLEGITEAEYLSANMARLQFIGTREITERIIASSIQKGWRLQEIQLEKISLDKIFAQLSNKN